MKYLKNYALFQEADETGVTTKPDNTVKPATKEDDNKADTEFLTSVQKSLSEYKSKKSKMDQIYAQKDVDINKIKDDIQTSVYNNQKDVKKKNPYLLEYESILDIQNKINSINKALNDYMVDKDNTNKSIREFTQRLSEESEASQEEKDKIKAQIDTNKKHLIDIQKGMTFNKQQLSLSEKNIELKKRNFDIKIKSDINRIKDLLKTQK